MVRHRLNELEKYSIDAHHIFKTTKEKLDYVNEKMVGKPVTKTIFYRVLKKLTNDPTTQHYTNKRILGLKKIEILDELDKTLKEICDVPIEPNTKTNQNKRMKLQFKSIKIWDMIKVIDNTPHKIL